MRKSVIQVPIDKELLDRLDLQAKSQSVSRAELIRTACKRYVRELEREEIDRQIEEGYRRFPDQTTEEETRAWLAAAAIEPEEWPEAPPPRPRPRRVAEATGAGRPEEWPEAPPRRS